ncbi:unnamed protein product [Chironomus riparius]|uniref:UDP-glucuronosyltransferase n=1 Tax=Chironomus riparius TaxID=315576 RepID=A0A9N9WVY4_9DIPT|nr:unnamed protein product [Chironomus riparius]
MCSIVKQIFLVFFIVGQGYCANVLYLHGVLSPSHHIWNRALAKGLADSGHNVTFLSTDEPKGEVKNLHYIVLEGSYQNLDKIMALKGDDFNIMDYAKESESSKINAARVLSDYAILSCDAIYNSKNGIEKILSYPDDFKFDIVIYDFTCSACLLPIIHKFNYPSIVGVSAFLNPPYTHFLIGGNKYPAYVPHYLLDFKPPMTFYERFYNLLIYSIEDLSFEYELYPGLEKTVRKHLNFKDLPSIKEIEQKTKLLLLNSDHAIDYPEPLQPNMVLVGGLQITEPKELPADIKKFVESGKKGTVLMSLGTNILSNLLGDVVLTSILKTFESLPEYNFIWKFESEPHELPIKPSKNVMVSKFLPQNDLLAHSNLKAFITHAGGLSTQESLWYGKPMVGIPFIDDQYRTIEKSVTMGVGVKLEIAKLNVDIFRKAIKEVIENPSYTENAQKISKLFQDKPKKPLETAIWWIEYVLRNPDAPIYKSPTLELGFLASNNYDIYLVIIACLHIIGFSIRAVYLKLFGNKSTKKVKTN